MGTKGGVQPKAKNYIVTENGVKVEKWAPNINDLSKHSIERMKERVIHKSMIQDTINFPLKITEVDNGGGYNVYGKNTVLTISAKSGKVITVRRTGTKERKELLNES